MPYKKITDLPKSIQDNLPKHAQEIYKEAFNNAYIQYSNQSNFEEITHKVAWSAVKQKYEKNSDGKWRLKK